MRPPGREPIYAPGPPTVVEAGEFITNRDAAEAAGGDLAADGVPIFTSNALKDSRLLITVTAMQMPRPKSAQETQAAYDAAMTEEKTFT